LMRHAVVSSHFQKICVPGRFLKRARAGQKGAVY
jgi:hypothetical protein